MRTLTSLESRIVVHLANKPDVSITYMTNTLGATYAGTHRAIIKLRQLGLLTTSKVGREVRMNLTEKGQKIGDAVLRIFNIEVTA